VEVIAVLKNHEDFMKKNSNQAPAYHGLFATHPRNDTRLQEAVRNSTGNGDALRAEVDPDEFRLATTGLIVGPTLQNMTGNQGRNRYYQTLLSYTMVLPDAWIFEETTTTMTAKSPEPAATDGAEAGEVTKDGQGVLKVEVQRLQQNLEPRIFIRDVLKIPNLQQAEPLRQFGLDGYTGINPATKERLAVVYYGRRAFVFTGTASNEALHGAMLDSVKSFRPIARNEGIFADPLETNWIQAQNGMTYEALGKQSRLPQFPVDTLRLMNGDYPGGEPTPGEWIKIAN
jgi:predicted Zn-dependent protease